MTKNPPAVSIPMIVSVLLAFASLYLSTESPFVLILPLFVVASLLLPARFERDSAGIWGVRLLIYAGFAILGRTPTGAPSYFVDSQSFTTAGLIAGGELCLQLFRKPPEGARFDPYIVSLSGVVFLIACNTSRGHIWVLAPLYVLFLLLSLIDLRPRAAQKRRCFFTQIRRIAMISVAVALGAALHQSLWANRNSIMAVGARILAAGPLSEMGVQPGDNPQLSNTFGGNTSTARLLSIKGSLSDGRLRSASFDRYHNGDWGPPLSRREPLDAALPQETGEEYPAPKRGDVPRDLNDAKITLLRETGGILFAPLNSHAIMPAIGQSLNWDRFQGPFKTEEPAPVTYYVTNPKQSFYGWEIEQGPLCVAPDEKQRERLLDVPPEIDPKVSELALQTTRKGRSQAEKAAQIIDYLFKHNAYSLNFVRGSQDPVSDFVLNKRAAHCQYFASASVMMLRAVGIPARYASGYYAQETGRDGTTIVRGRDAHAWTEAYLDKIGWVSLDATPPAGRADPAVNPTPFYQSTLERAEDQFSRVRAWFGHLTQLQIGGIVLVIALLWGLERARQNWLQKRRLPPGQTPPPALAPLARRFERLLARRGVALSEGRPWSESVSNAWPKEREWVDEYNRARFAAADLETLRALERELEALEKPETTTKP